MARKTTSNKSVKQAITQKKISAVATVPEKQEQPKKKLLSRADTLIDEINDKREQIKQTIHELTAERKEIDRQLGRLNAFLVRLGGGGHTPGAAPAHAPAPTQSSGRLTTQVKEQLRAKVLTFLPSVSSQGMGTPDIAARLHVPSKRAAQIMSSLREDGKVATIGERAGMKYYRNGHG